MKEIIDIKKIVSVLKLLCSGLGLEGFFVKFFERTYLFVPEKLLITLQKFETFGGLYITII